MRRQPPRSPSPRPHDPLPSEDNKRQALVNPRRGRHRPYHPVPTRPQILRIHPRRPHPRALQPLLRRRHHGHDEASHPARAIRILRARQLPGRGRPPPQNPYLRISALFETAPGARPGRERNTEPEHRISRNTPQAVGVQPRPERGPPGQKETAAGPGDHGRCDRRQARIRRTVQRDRGGFLDLFPGAQCERRRRWGIGAGEGGLAVPVHVACAAGAFRYDGG